MMSRRQLNKKVGGTFPSALINKSSSDTEEDKRVWTQTDDYFKNQFKRSKKTDLNCVYIKNIEHIMPRNNKYNP